MQKRPDGDWNIPREIKDPYYRYHMPPLRVKVEGRGNGIKTVIENMQQVALALERPPSYTTKFFGIELGAQTTVNAQKAKFVVNGSHDSDTLQTMLDKFIQKFLLCSRCGNPETTMEVTKNGLVEMYCRACSETTVADATHKLCSYIEKNPPSAQGLSKAAKATQELQERMNKATDSAKKSGKKSDSADGSSSSSSAASVAAAAKPKTAEELEFEEEWADQVDDASVSQRQKGLLGVVSESTSSALSTSGNGEDSTQSKKNDVITELGQFLTKTPPPTGKEIVSHVKALAQLNGWKDHNLIGAVFGALFGSNILKVLTKRTASILGLFVQSEQDQKYVLYHLEKLCTSDPNATAKIGTILNAFYDNDVLEEAVLMKWHKYPAKKFDPEQSRRVRSNANEFITWLQQAGDEEDEADGDEE